MSSSGPKTSTPASPAGDLLLGPQLRNSRGGFYIGELPAELASNGTYAALRVIEQDVKAFEKLLDDVKKQHSVARELTAAKLVGRWRNGSPLALYPSQAREERTPTPAELIDTFDYTGQKYPAEARALAKTGSAPTEPINDDEGRRCPFGAHVRRLNPRSGMVLGVPWGRRIVRRGMPYGSKFDRTFPTDEPRGLVGLFLCGDLESQFEFIQHVWANQDLSAPGLRDTQDVFSSANAGTPFRFRPQEFGEEISITVPPLTTTIGSAYLFMPGIEAVRWLGREGWKQMAARNSSKTSRATTMGKLVLDAASRQFLDSPYEQYAAFRKQAPVGEVGAPYGTLWVFSHKLVTEVNQKKDVFLKPGGKRTDAAVGPFAPVNHLKDGLFFMDPPRHGQVRPLLDKIFDKAIVDARQYAEEAAKGLLDAALPLGQMDAIGDYAGQVASQVFFRVMGVPQMAWQLVDNWVRSALNSHRATMPLEQRAIGGSAGLAMRVYLRGLMVEAGNSSPLTLLAGMHGMTASTGTATKMDSDEAMNTAMHFALGGYLSTEFLIGTGVFNLLRNPEQWQLLLNNRKLMDQAIDEMLRYDAPFQLADRWVEKTGVTLGGVAIPPNTGLAVVYGSANRDEKVFSNPDRFDITRDLRKSPKDPTPNFGFGDGIHRCIGEWLARPVTAVAINALLERCPSARIAEYQWGADPYFRTLTKLQLYLR